MSEILENDIAIIGMAGSFPKAANIEQYWQNLVNGLNSVEAADEESLVASGLPEELINNKRFVNASSRLEDGRFFDADFFRLSKAEAVLLDPQIRLLLQTSFHALEDAGYDPARLDATVGNFCGMSTNSYLMRMVDTKAMAEGVDPLMYRILNEKDFLATWISYKLNLTGPAMSLQTACSTSLLAVHQACQSLLNFECEMALAGGSTYDSSEQVGYLHVPESIYSKDGVCRPFDKDASGTIMGDGVGAVLLKRTADAIKDGDNIYALIKGTAVNNDGANKQGYTTPSVDMQRDVVLEALGMANIIPETIGMIEAHGTGTLIGDPIEVSALTEAYREYTGKLQYCAIGSVKGNIGHLDAAAGVASFIKAVLCVNKGELVPSINYNEPNPALNLSGSPFYVSELHSKWPDHFCVRRAGISSLGVGGTNVHVIVEQPPAKARIENKTYQPDTFTIGLSAQNESSLNEQKQRLAQHLRANPGLQLADIEHTALFGRKQLSHRFSTITNSIEELINQLEGEFNERTFTGYHEKAAESVFLFPGQGSQYPGMTSSLYAADFSFQEDMDKCFNYLKSLSSINYKDLIFDGDATSLGKTENTQVALFVVEYCLAKALMRTGVKPSVLIGHSLGEYVAACIAECLSLKDTLKLVYHRGRLMGMQPEGGMLLVRIPYEELTPLLEDGVFVCVMNSQSNIVIGGSLEAIQHQATVLELNGIKASKLEVSHAYHTPMMKGALAEYADILNEIEFSEPRFTIYSTHTGTMVNVGEFSSSQYWLYQIMKPVKFMHAVSEVHDNLTSPVYIEVGPGNGLSSFVKAITEQQAHTVNLLPRGRGEDSSAVALHEGRAMLFAKGVTAGKPEGQRGSSVRLPGYAFSRQYFWKPQLNIHYKRLEDIKQAYHQSNKRYLSDRLKTTVEIYIGGIQEIPAELLDKMNELHTQYIKGIKDLLGDQKKNLTSDIQVLYQNAAYQDQYEYVQSNGPDNKRTVSSVFQAPETETEKMVAIHWQNILGYGLVGVLDNYFEAGGNSLLATQLINRLTADFDIEITISDILSNPTIKDLSSLLDEKLWLNKDEEMSNELII